MAKILYIEDIADNATLARRMLTTRGHEFLWAQDAESGLEMALAEHPDLILLDLGLPDVDGQTLSVWLRAEPELEHIPLVALTAWPEEVARKMVEAYGLNGYLGKPLEMHSLLKLVETLLAR
jgi:two-component system cell cycle response regulator DivK